MIPIPPGKVLEAFGGAPVETLADRLRGHAANDRVGSDVLCDHGTRSHDRAVADGYAGQDGRAVAKPGVMADSHRIAAPPVEEFFLMRCVVPIIRGAIGE